MEKKSLKIKELYDTAIQNHQKRNFQIAINIYKEILKIDSNHFESIYLLGTVYLQTKKINEAKQMFTKSIRIRPNDVEVNNNLGITFNKLGEYEKAISCYKKIIKIQPGYAYAYNNCGNTLKLYSCS